MNNYILTIKGEEVKAQGCNLESALDRKGIVFTSIKHAVPRKLNGRYDVYCGSTFIHAVWLEKYKNK
jgi:hypothetical protein